MSLLAQKTSPIIPQSGAVEKPYFSGEGERSSGPVFPPEPPGQQEAACRQGGAEQEVRDLGQDQRLSVPGGEIGEDRTCAESLQPLGIDGSEVRDAAQPEACSQSGGDPDQAQDPDQRHQVSGDEAVCTPEAGKTAFPRPGGGGSRVRLFIVQQIVHRDAQQTADGQELVGVGQGLAGFPKLKILVMYECLRLLA